jgi:hypothetical protein
MSISSIAAPPPIAPVKAPEASEPKAADAKTDSDTDDSRGVQPTVRAPLPPGQGTRIDQLA